MVIRELINELKAILNENVDFEAKEIAMNILGITNNDIVLNPKRTVSEEEYEKAISFAKRRAMGEPLQYILGNCEFMSLSFDLNSDTLIPRSDTETLIEKLIDVIGDSSPRIIDIGTGSGCVGISLAKYTSAQVTLADINKNALNMAAFNAKKNDVNVSLLNIDILNEIPNGEFDIIVSNPPYIRSDVINTLQTEVKDFEPRIALDGGDDGLIFYRRITEIAPQVLSKNGILAYEIGYDQGKEVKMLMEKDFCDIAIIKDLCSNERVVIGIKK